MRAKLSFGYSGCMLRQAAMAKDRQDIVLQRRKPTQARARATMDMIFEATARIIERDGIAALNTNRIAERAGVSIGTLYEYFFIRTPSSLLWHGSVLPMTSAWCGRP